MPVPPPSRAQAPATYAPPPRATEYLVRETWLADGAVSVRLDIPLSPVGRKPTVIALLRDTHQLVGAGFVAVTYRIDWARLKGPKPTPIPPEQVVGKWVLAAPSAAVLGENYLRSIAATATEYIPLILDWLETVPEVDTSHLGIIGGSTNGFIALQAVAADHRLGVAVAVAACGDYHRFLRDSSMGMQGRPLTLAPDYEAWLRRQEIIRDPRAVVHAAVLMVNRVQDELIPISCADETARILTRAYDRHDAAARFRYVRLDQPGHGMGLEERRDGMAWLQQWLQGQPASPSGP